MDIKLGYDFYLTENELNKIMDGSLEGKLQRIHSALGDTFAAFDEDVELIATYDDHVVFLGENGVMRCDYVDDGVNINFSKERKVAVPIMTSESLVVDCVDDCSLDINNIGDSLRRLVFSEDLNISVPIDEINGSLDKLFNSNELWYKTIIENKDEFSSVVGNQAVAFVEYLNQDNFDMRGLLVSLEEMRDNLDVIYNKVDKSYKTYVRECNENIVGDTLYEDFNRFCDSFISGLKDISNFVSESFDEFNSGGCSVCAATVHDYVCNNMLNIKLAERFVRLVASKSIS